MERDSRRIDELFRQRMDPLRVSPPPMAWERLSDALDEGAGQPINGAPVSSMPTQGGAFTGWMRKSWSGIAVAGLLFSSLFLTPERIGYTAAHQQVMSSGLNNHLNQEGDVSQASASLGNLAHAAGIAVRQAQNLVQTPVNPGGATPQENLVPIPAARFEHEGTATAPVIAPNPRELAAWSLVNQNQEVLPAAQSNTRSQEAIAATTPLTSAPETALEQTTPVTPGTVTPATLVTPTTPTTLATRPQGPSPWKNFYGGVHGSLQWTGLLSQNNAQPDVNLNPMLNIGYAFGVHAGYRFNPRISLETGLVLNSMQGSRYESSVSTRNEEVPVTKSLMLHYTQLPLTVRISPGRNPQGAVPEGWSYVGGLQYGMLRTSKLRIEDKPVNPDRNLQQHDLAVLLGMDYDLPLNDQLFLTLGFRGSLGLNQANVTTVEGINSDKRNAVLGFRAAFNGFLLPQ
ncbi:MAG: outer membrane beta-barrel protein [Bacteroidetes bacterium]|nr:outer membrane beta-barrel protein [Bacteroidota bacterium]